MVLCWLRLKQIWRKEDSMYRMYSTINSNQHVTSCCSLVSEVNSNAEPRCAHLRPSNEHRGSTGVGTHTITSAHTMLGFCFVGGENSFPTITAWEIKKNPQGLRVRERDRKTHRVREGGQKDVCVFQALNITIHIKKNNTRECIVLISVMTSSSRCHQCPRSKKTKQP